jgi:hypothetical protein
MIAYIWGLRLGFGSLSLGGLDSLHWLGCLGGLSLHWLSCLRGFYNGSGCLGGFGCLGGLNLRGLNLRKTGNSTPQSRVQNLEAMKI